MRTHFIRPTGQTVAGCSSNVVLTSTYEYSLFNKAVTCFTVNVFKIRLRIGIGPLRGVLLRHYQNNWSFTVPVLETHYRSLAGTFRSFDFTRA